MKYFIPAVVWGGIILALSVSPGTPFKPFEWSDIFQIDKLGHLVFYGVWVALILWGVHKSTQANSISLWVIIGTLLFTSLFGYALEMVQWKLLPDRYFDILDIIANIIGCMTGLLSLRFLKK